MSSEERGEVVYVRGSRRLLAGMHRAINYGYGLLEVTIRIFANLVPAVFVYPVAKQLNR